MKFITIRHPDIEGVGMATERSLPALAAKGWQPIDDQQLPAADATPEPPPVVVPMSDLPPVLAASDTPIGDALTAAPPTTPSPLES
jgi:hypothetical protein